MDGIKRTIIGTITTIIIGGSAYTISQTDVVNNFAKDTGMSQRQAEEYVNGIKKEDLVSWNKLGNDFISDGNDVLAAANKIDCNNYEYKWESGTLSCEVGKAQLVDLGNSELSLGRAYIKLGTDNAQKEDIAATVECINTLSTKYAYEIVGKLVNSSTITEFRNSNSYNKATLQTALDSN